LWDLHGAGDYGTFHPENSTPKDAMNEITPALDPEAELSLR
jgi:hypothetical protein